MGYDLNITRRNDTDDTYQESEITVQEWLDYIASDPELEISGDNATDNAPESLYYEWNAHPLYREAGSRPWFQYYNGYISTKNPDSHVILKMIDMAAALKARVQGEEGEYYDEESEELKFLLDAMNGKPVTIETTIQKKPWWKFW